MTSSSPNEAGVDRERMRASTRAVLSRGGSRNADVVLVEAEVGPVVVKDFRPRSVLVRRLVGPWLLRREERAYRRLAGVASVPRLLGRVDATAIVLEYRPGELLSRRLAGRVPDDFVDQLEIAVAEIHRRGIVHLDLRHRSNVLATPDGRPVVIDFASALVFDPASVVGRLCVRAFGVVDRRALRKWRDRLGPIGSGPARGSARAHGSASDPASSPPREAAQARDSGSSAGSRGASRAM
jgi:serine/threonine protein kinase